MGELPRHGGVLPRGGPGSELASQLTARGADYIYDALRSLRAVDLPDGRAIDYVIDGQARRVGKKINGTLVQGFLYRDQLRIAAELDGAGNLVAQFVYVGDHHSPDYMLRGNSVYRFVKDQNGSPRPVVDAFTGNVVHELEFDEFGNVVRE